MDADRQAYEERCEKNRENGKLGGRPKKTEQNQMVSEETDGFLNDDLETDQNPTKPKKPDIDSDIDIDIDIGIKKKTKAKEKEDLLPVIGPSVTKSNASVTDSVTKSNESKSKSKSKSKNNNIEPYSDNPKLDETIREFIENRKVIKKPMTDLAVTKMLNKLNSMATDDEEKIAILNQSIMYGWQGIFPLKDDSVRNNQPKRRDPILDGKKGTSFNNFENRQIGSDVIREIERRNW